MPTPLRRRLRLARRGLGFTLAGLLVLAALAVGVASQLLPLAERNPQRIAGWLGARVGQPVAFDAVRTQWTRRGPLLRLDGLRIGRGRQVLTIGDAELLVAPYAGWLPNRSLTELRLRALELELLRDPAGRWHVRGLPGQRDAGGDPLDMLGRLGELQVSEASLRLRAPELGIDAQVPRIDLRLQVDDARVRVGARAWMREGSQPVRGALELRRGSGEGRGWADAGKADLAEWSDLLRFAGVAVGAGQGRAQAWVKLVDHRVVGIDADTDLTSVRLLGAALPGRTTPSVEFGQLAGRLHWAGTVQQWRLDAPRLRIADAAGNEQRLDGLVLEAGRRWGLQADNVQAGPLLATLALSDFIAPGLRRWLLDARPQALLHDVAMRAGDGRSRLKGRIEAAGFAPIGNAPGLSGIAGTLEGDGQALRLVFDPAAAVRFDWPRGFGVVHELRLTGEATGWRDAAGWNVRTPGLRIDGRGLRVDARGGIGFQDDGSRPRLDLAASIPAAPVALANGFWVRHLMPPATVRWLESALQGGSVHDVQALVVGDLDDWPFRREGARGGAGLFRIEAGLRDGRLKFLPDWPMVEQLQARLRFEADGMQVQGSGRIGQVQASQVTAVIPRFGKAELAIDALSNADAGDYLALLRASPLHEQHGEVMDALRVAGPARASFMLRLPLHRGGPPMQLGGDVTLDGVRMQETRWNVDLAQVRGQARYDRRGFVAEQLSVRHDGTPGRLSLRAGGTRDPAQAFEAELQADALADTLLDKAPAVAWLKPYLEGRSQWTVAVAIPRGNAGAAPSRLTLRSNLVGTAFSLPAPLRKPAAQPLPTSVDIALPLERGNVEVRLGNLASVRTRGDGRRSGVRVQFGDAAAAAPPGHGLVVGGRADVVDALDWITLLGGGGGGRGSDLPLQRVDVQARRLRLLGGEFPDTRVVLVPAAGGATAIQASGAALSGALLIPAQAGAQVAGRFDRVHWRAPGKPAGAPVAARAAPAGDIDIDPARIPPLLFDVGDLRLGDAALGQARFRSRPLGAGMRVDEISARGQSHVLQASGEWSGRGAAARTRLQARIESDRVGTLATQLGLAGQLAGGKGLLQFEGGWPGSPAAFDAGRLQATLALEVRDGRLLEIEPGAGRVLGLLSIAQLPRRLSLDFRDFFDKGFAFERIAGDIRVADGQARSDNLGIEGPAADIRIRGSADLRTQQFDQTVEVLPKTGGLLTAAGALVGGPVGAAVGAVANAVLDKPLQQASARTYRVTGPWKDPKVEVVQRASARTPP